MEIFVNQEKINFVLGEEKSLTEIIAGLGQWSEGSDLIIYSLRVDGEEIVDFHNLEKTNGYSVADIKKVECTILSKITYTIYVLDDFNYYLNHFKNLDDDGFMKQLPTLNAYLDYFKKSSKLAEKILKLEKDFLVFKGLLKDLEIEFFKIKNQDKKYSQSELKNIVDRLIHFIRESRFKFNLMIMNSFLKQENYALKNLLENSLIFLGQLENHLVTTSMHFQKSQTYLALQKLIEAINGLELLFFIMNALRKKLKDEDGFSKISGNFDRYHDDLEVLLEQIKASLKKKDFIEISDVLEYEIKEIVPLIKRDFSLLMSKIEKKDLESIS